MMKKIMLISAVMFTATQVFGQAITGKVVDENSAPMEFTNVVLVNKADTAYVVGTVTGADGVFSLGEEVRQPAMVKISSVGYRTIFRDIPPTGSLGTIAMSPESVMLGEVTVRSGRPVTAIKGDALVTTVTGSQLEHAGTANDVLSQVPMVLGRDGNFEVFGKGSPAIYVNGREVQDINELSQLNSSDIKSVEVVTNPGAKYDASVKSVIRIRTKRPAGDGFSGTIRVQGRSQKYFSTLDQANFKYRAGALELFARLGYIGGKFQSDQDAEIITRSSVLWNQSLSQSGSMHKNEFFGTAGFSYLFNEKHSVGAYYNNAFNKERSEHYGVTDVLADGEAYDHLLMRRKGEMDALPKHYANAYYNGEVAGIGIDFNMDYIWRKGSDRVLDNESGGNAGVSEINSLGVSHSRMFAEKLVLSYPFWNGGIELGEECSASRFASVYTTDAAIVDDASSCTDEKNIAGFVEIGQAFGRFNIGAGLRYEHVNFDYIENGQRKEDRSKSYNNLFPSLSVSGMIRNVQLSLGYTQKIQRPGYADLDGTVDYINPYTLESGNPYLLPEKVHALELTGAWRQFFGQLTYTYKEDPIMNTTRPYDEEGKVKLLTMGNFPKIQVLQAFAGAQFQIGIWQPRVNAGIIKQWLTIDYGNSRKSLDNPVGLVQLQNAVKLPCDIWLNADMQWMSAGNSGNTRQKASSYLNLKLYKAFLNNSLSVTLEANDIFNRGSRDVALLSRDVEVLKFNRTTSRMFVMTLQYTFNSSRDRYRGTGAGKDEEKRL